MRLIGLAAKNRLLGHCVVCILKLQFLSKMSVRLSRLITFFQNGVLFPSLICEGLFEKFNRAN